MKVLFLTNIPSPYRVDFFEELSAYCDLTVLYELPCARDREASWVKRKVTDKYETIYLKPVLKKASCAWCPSVGRYIKKGIYDVIVVGGYSTPTGIQAICRLKRKKIPYIINCDGGFVPQQEKKMKYWLKKYLLSGSAAYLSSGQMADEYLMHYGAAQGAIHRYPFTSLYRNDISKRPISVSEKKVMKRKLGMIENKIILSVGSFIHRKGFDILLKAAYETEDRYGVYIVGGMATEEYRSMAEEYHLKHVHFLPFMQSEELKQYYQAADVFVLPTREDIWGLVINEAMAAGLSVITTDKCAAGRELLDEEWIVPAEDFHALSNAMMRILEDEALQDEISSRNLQKIRAYTIENMAMAHRDIFEVFRVQH